MLVISMGSLEPAGGVSGLVLLLSFFCNLKPVFPEAIGEKFPIRAAFAIPLFVANGEKQLDQLLEMVATTQFWRYGAASLLIAGQAAALTPANSPSRFLKTNTRPDQTAELDKKYPDIKAYNLSVPVDHFHNDSRYAPHSDDKFPLRYYLDTSNYKPGGPVIVLASGEDDASDRLPYIQYGIVPILTKATGGIGIVLEHRYYGTSFPVPDLTNPNLRFLSTEQALADTAYFAKNVQFPGLEHLNLTAPNAPWIIYGGSYAGAFAAFSRKVYPDVFWGAISSSGVTAAIEDYWQYYEAARLFAPGDCGLTTQKLTKVVDTVLFGNNKTEISQLKNIFGLGGLESDYDFAVAISSGINGLQGTNWDPEQDDAGFGAYCGSVTSDSLLYSSTAYLKPVVQRLVAQSGLATLGDGFVNRVLNYIGWMRSFTKSACGDHTVLECFGPPSSNDTSYASSDFRSWTYQVCTQWGYFQTGSGTPKNQLSIVSRKVTLEASSSMCKTVFNVTTRPDVESINKLGGFNFSYPRVAIIDGKQDPWRQATPHAIGLPPRVSTVSEPYLLIDPGVHHWDEYGVPDDEKNIEGFPPKQIVTVQAAMVEFVKAWVKEWHSGKGKRAAKRFEDFSQVLEEQPLQKLGPPAIHSLQRTYFLLPLGLHAGGNLMPRQPRRSRLTSGKFDKQHPLELLIPEPEWFLKTRGPRKAEWVLEYAQEYGPEE
ncbi:putative extracellular serine carboxypeptidase [Cladobotryum mycophilum]|uniref:Extracellular serine carboxypeptidase n=1 Tax=Cladobotryum mycophilum TaxID=491253 RepID=A0ABR0SWI7_9HYPO